MTSPAPRKIVVTDANILINFLNIGRLDLLTTLPGFAFAVPDHVDAEILKPEQRAALERAFADGKLSRETLTDLEALKTFAELRPVMGQGEAACIALARRKAWIVASDEGGVVRRKALELLGPDRLLNTPGIMVLAIKAGTLDLDEADRLKDLLERCRFKMKFGSFREVVGGDSKA